MINSLITRGYQYIDRKNLRGVCYHLIDLNDNLIGMLHICEVQGIIEFNKVSDECTKEDFEGVYTFEKITKNEFFAGRLRSLPCPGNRQAFFFEKIPV